MLARQIWYTVAVRFGMRSLIASCGASGVRGMLELLKAVRESSKILTCPSSLYLSGYRLLVYFFLLLIWLRCLIVVLCVLNVGVLCVHILCTGVAFLCYF